jgi:rhodanese-related sulfurtransferase
MPWAMLTTSPEVDQVDPDVLAALGDEALVLDVREPEEYHHGHVPGAVNVPQAELASRLEEIPRDRTLYVVCQGGLRSLRAARFLLQRGRDRVVNVRGGTGAWEQAGRPLSFGDTTMPKPRVAEPEWAHGGARVTQAG